MTAELEQLLEAAHLRYASLESPGIRRVRRGKNFAYLNTNGEVIRDKKLREWIDSLVIPPAWEEVWISPHKNSHILAVGRDSRGRKQYRYHPRWQKHRSENRYAELAKFGRALPHIRQVTDADLRKSGLPKEKVLAVVIRLLERTLIRVGNPEYARQNKTFGLTTLKDRHVSVDGSRISFDFIGKSKKEVMVDLEDRRLARAVKACRDIPGYELFQYIDEDGQRQSINSADVNVYLKEITSEAFTAKFFRMWGGSVAALRFLAEQARSDDPLSPEKQVIECVKAVAKQLGNTTAVCRAHYIHPAVVQACLDGALAEVMTDDAEPNSSYALHPDEEALLCLIDKTK